MVGALCLLGAVRVVHAVAECADADADAVRAALADIERSVDPCGESGEVRGIIAEFRRCAHQGVRICTDLQSERNYIERGATDGVDRSTIVWNPGLRTQLETGCGGDPARVVLRDPTASLLHEVVHAVQQCHGLEPSEHELEAVRVENIYRRARRMCQRTRYGEQRLPAHMLIGCDPGRCGCTGRDAGLTTAAARPVPGLPQAAGDMAAGGER